MRHALSTAEGGPDRVSRVGIAGVGSSAQRRRVSLVASYQENGSKLYE